MCEHQLWGCLAGYFNCNETVHHLRVTSNVLMFCAFSKTSSIKFFETLKEVKVYFANGYSLQTQGFFLKESFSVA